MTIVRSQTTLRNGDTNTAGGKIVCIPKSNRPVRTTRDKVWAVRTGRKLDGVDFFLPAVEYMESRPSVNIPDAERGVTAC